MTNWGYAKQYSETISLVFGSNQKSAADIWDILKLALSLRIKKQNKSWVEKTWANHILCDCSCGSFPQKDLLKLERFQGRVCDQR